MLTVSDKQQIAPGVFCTGTQAMHQFQEEDCCRVVIEPEASSEVMMQVILSDKTTLPKYHIEIHFRHPHAKLKMTGLYQLMQSQAISMTTTIHHHVPHCESEQLWKGVMQDQSSMHFEGKMIVYPDAQKTKAHLVNKNLLLSKSATVSTKPILEIYADDVQCTHGATVGCLDENALFYLQSRGISENVARDILVEAFVGEVRSDW